MGKQGSGLEYDAEVAAVGRDVREGLPFVEYVTGSRCVEAREHHERSGLSAAGGSEKSQELAGVDVQIHAAQRRAVLAEVLVNIDEAQQAVAAVVL